MKNDLFEKAKQAVAEKHGRPGWESLTSGCVISELEELFAEVGEWMCNEAVKADRVNIISQCVDEQWLKEPNWDCSELMHTLDKDRFDLLPLPFPQQPDER